MLDIVLGIKMMEDIYGNFSQFNPSKRMIVM